MRASVTRLTACSTCHVPLSQDSLLDEQGKGGGSGLSDAEVAIMYGLVDENGEYDEDAVAELQEQLASETS